jgi:type II secretory pathway pseudopilin PulG
MINGRFKSARGISLVSLVITTLVLIILANVIIYNANDDIKATKLKKMQNDIENLRDKVSSYYAQNGKIPASLVYANQQAINKIKDAGVISDAVDTGDFLVIDLSAIENLTLNRGKDFEKVKENSANVDSCTDLYIINETSHNIFYVAGITINDKTYYTDYISDDVDTDSVNLRYIDGIKIPEGYYYVEGTKDTGIVIKNNSNTQEYTWISVSEKITQVPDDLNVETSEIGDFIISVNDYQGYYKSTSDNDVVYLGIKNWSPVYDKDGKYTDKNGDTAYIPQGFQVSTTPGENKIDEGLVVKDSNDNEWVWIEVPSTVFTTATGDTDYDNIKADLIEYAKDYRESSYEDEWYEGCGLSQSNYEDLYNKMLTSVYKNRGFYIARYEAGIEGSDSNIKLARDDSSDRITESTISKLPIAVSKKNMIPYNFVYCSEAQQLASNMATENKTTSLLFGIQWDLVCKFLEIKANWDTTKTASYCIKENSASWGNYDDNTFTIYNANAKKYSSVWEAITGEKTESILLTTGASEYTKKMNIYDFAGNAGEWTLEKSISQIIGPCTGRGGSYVSKGNDSPVITRRDGSIVGEAVITAFRVALY